MDFGIAGKVAVVAGGSRGIGRATAIDLGREGCKVVVVARSHGPIDETVAAIRAAGGTAMGISADLTDKDEIGHMLEQARAAFGPVEIGIFNTDGALRGRFEETTDEDFAEAYNTFALSYTWFMRQLLPQMKQKKWGRVVTIGSMSVKMPHREYPLILHNSARAAALGIARTLADEYAQHGITINTLGTGSIETGKFKKVFDQLAKSQGISYEEVIDEKTSAIPAGRLGTPEEMAAVAVFLCSARASFVTGQMILVDGGRVNIFH
jgi:3-oxoacyl-[acyl-carrier protein] reductase